MTMNVPTSAVPAPDTVRPRQDPDTLKRSVVAICGACGRTLEEAVGGWLHFLTQQPTCPVTTTSASTAAPGTTL